MDVNLHSKHDYRKPLTKEIALALAVEDLDTTEAVQGVPFNPVPVSLGRIEVGWLFEFAPMTPFSDDGRKVYHFGPSGLLVAAGYKIGQVEIQLPWR